MVSKTKLETFTIWDHLKHSAIEYYRFWFPVKYKNPSIELSDIRWVNTKKPKISLADEVAKELLRIHNDQSNRV